MVMPAEKHAWIYNAVLSPATQRLSNLKREKFNLNYGARAGVGWLSPRFLCKHGPLQLISFNVALE
jgi:hypothetical protein